MATLCGAKSRHMQSMLLAGILTIVELLQTSVTRRLCQEWNTHF